MTIKAIKEKYKDYQIRGNEKNMFVIFEDNNEKFVVVVNSNKSYGKTVTQIIKVSNGKEMLQNESCRPCDNLQDAVDVAMEMMTEAD